MKMQSRFKHTLSIAATVLVGGRELIQLAEILLDDGFAPRALNADE